MHLSNGELRAYQDRELDERAMERASAHLAACKRCQARAEDLAGRATSVSRRMEGLDHLPGEGAVAAGSALVRFERRYPSKEKMSMFHRMFAKPYRTAWIGLGIVAIIAIAMAFSPVRAIANSFLGLFRVQQFTIVQVNPGDLPEQLGSSSQFQYLISNEVQVEEIGETQTVSDAAEASALAGIPVRLPAGMHGESKLNVQPGAKVSLQIDLQKIRSLLREIGREDITLPDEIDGALVTMDMPRAVTASYGDCENEVDVRLSEADREAGGDPDMPVPQLADCTTLVQMSSPVISAPPGLDIAALGEAFLVVMGMPQEEAAHFSQQIDWTTTLVVPIPRYGTNYRDVNVDGVTGTLIQQSLEDHAPQYMLVWIKEDVLYALAGPGRVDSALAIAKSLQ
jgi:hypothetical protein